MTIHLRHPGPGEREEFLVDGCPRCAEYLDDLGLSFDEQRFRAFWQTMVAVEFQGNGGYHSLLDADLGLALYKVALSLQRAFGFDPTFTRRAR